MMTKAILGACVCTMVIALNFSAGAADIRRSDTNSVAKPRGELEKSREEWKKLSPDERAAKIKEFRGKSGTNRIEWQKKRDEFLRMTPEEREAKRKELKERLEAQIAALRAKQTSGTISPKESRDLERREQILRRFEQGSFGVPPGQPKPPPSGSAPDAERRREK